MEIYNKRIRGNKMKVLFLTNIPSPYRVDFFNELGKYCDLTVLYERKTASNRDKKWISEGAINYKEVFLKGKHIRYDAAICLDVIKWINPNNFDIFIVGGYSTPTAMLAIQTLKLKKIPFILNTDGGFIKSDKKIIHSIKRYFISSANWWLSTGKLTNEYLEHYGANKENIFIYPFTSIKKEEIIKKNLSNNEKNKLRKELNINSEKLAISVGQFIDRKGYDLLIDSWKTVGSEWKLLIIGSGPEEESLSELINSNNLNNVELVQFKSKKELVKYYLSADIFILPTREDIWGLVINEAIAHGLGVISTNKCIAATEIIENNKNGYIIEIGEMNNICNILNSIGENDLYTMAELNIKKSHDYTIEKMAETHIDIFNNIKNEASQFIEIKNNILPYNIKCSRKRV